MKTYMVFFLLMISCSLLAQEQRSNFTREDFNALGEGVIVCKDRTVIKKVTLTEIKEYAIVYIKNKSLHDMMMDDLVRIEFPHCGYGPSKLEFPDHKAWLSDVADNDHNTDRSIQPVRPSRVFIK